jgi:hypothetical protein
VAILMAVYWRIYEITKHHSRQRLTDTQRMDKILHENQNNLQSNKIMHQNGHKRQQADGPKSSDLNHYDVKQGKEPEYIEVF